MNIADHIEEHSQTD